MSTSIDLTSSPLLILTRRDPICIFYSIALTYLRLRRRLITHVSFVDSIFNTVVEDFTQHYDTVLLLDICTEFNTRMLNNFKNVRKLLINEESISQLLELSTGDAKIRNLVEICKILYIYEKPEIYQDEIKVETLDHLNIPPLPGVTYLDFEKSIKLCIIPYIPDITGSDSVDIDLSKNIEDIIRHISEKIIRNKFSGVMLDSWLCGTYLLKNGSPIQDILLFLESSLRYEYYINMVDILNQSKLLDNDRVFNTCFKYVKEISNIVQEVLKNNTLTFEVDNSVLFYRLMKILRFYRKWKDVKIIFKPRRDVKCVASGSLDMSKSREYSIYEKDGVYIFCYEES